MSTTATVIYGVLLMLGGSVMNFLISVWVWEWKRKKQIPDEIRGEVDLLRSDVNALRGSIKYIEGRLNGRHWKSEGG